jgi:hypothetical protein
MACDDDDAAAPSDSLDENKKCPLVLTGGRGEAPFVEDDDTDAAAGFSTSRPPSLLFPTVEDVEDDDDFEALPVLILFVVASALLLFPCIGVVEDEDILSPAAYERDLRDAWIAFKMPFRKRNQSTSPWRSFRVAATSRPSVK